MRVLYRNLCRFKRTGVTIFGVILTLYLITGFYFNIQLTTTSSLSSREDQMSVWSIDTTVPEAQIAPQANKIDVASVLHTNNFDTAAANNYPNIPDTVQNNEGAKVSNTGEVDRQPLTTGSGNATSPKVLTVGEQNKSTGIIGANQREVSSWSKQWTSNSSALYVQSNNVLLAGIPRSQKVFVSIGLVTVKRDKANYFFNTIASLLKRSNDADKREMTFVVMLADRNQSYNEYILNEIQKRYPKQLQDGLLLVIRGAKTDFLFHNQDMKRTHNDSLMRVQWRSKQNLDYAALMEFSSNLSTYYLHIEDDVLAAESYLRLLKEFIASKANTLWAMLEVSPRGFIGKLFKNEDLPKLVMILRAFHLEQPCDLLIGPFINMMTQRKPIIRNGTLFFHQGQYSSLKNVTRPVDMPVKAILKTSSDHKNPEAEVKTDMTVYKKHEIVHAYDLQSKEFFWSSTVTEGKCVTIVFNKAQRLKSLVVETGFSSQIRLDILYNGTVVAGPAAPDLTQSLRCPDASKLGDFATGDFKSNVTLSTDVRCINIIVNSSQKEWLIIRSIFVYV